MRLECYREALQAVDEVRSVAFVVPEAHLSEVATVMREFPDAAAVAFVPTTKARCDVAAANVRVYRTQHLGRMHGVLAAKGPLDVLIEEPGEDGPGQFFAQLLWHVRAGGRYVVRHRESDTSNETTNQPPNPLGGVVDAVTRLYRNKAVGGREGPEVTADDLVLADSVASVNLGSGWTVVVRSGDGQVKVRHTELDFVVRHQSDPSWMRVISTTPARQVDTSTTMGVHNNQALREKLYLPSLSVPPLSVREYDEVVAHPFGILSKGALILPDTFRLWLSGRQRHGRLRDLSHYFAQIPASVGELPRLAGQYYYLDLEYNDHFGHFLTEAVGRLWAWPAAKAANPDLKLLVGVLFDWQRDLLECGGVPPEDIVVLPGAAIVESVVSAMPGYVIGRYVSEQARDTYRRIQAGMRWVDGPGDELVFLTREPGLWRECVNAAELEEYFVDRGFVLHRPELYSLPEQAALFREARVVAGYIGSQLYGQMFSPDPLQVVSFGNSSYGSTNEFFLAAALGHTLHQFWGVQHPPRRQVDVLGRPVNTAQQDYTFDFDADVGTLTSLLDRLVGSRGGARPRRWWRRRRPAAHQESTSLGQH